MRRVLVPHDETVVVQTLQHYYVFGRPHRIKIHTGTVYVQDVTTYALVLEIDVREICLIVSFNSLDGSYSTFYIERFIF